MANSMKETGINLCQNMEILKVIFTFMHWFLFKVMKTALNLHVLSVFAFHGICKNKANE